MLPTLLNLSVSQRHQAFPFLIASLHKKWTSRPLMCGKILLACPILILQVSSENRLFREAFFFLTTQSMGSYFIFFPRYLFVCFLVVANLGRMPKNWCLWTVVLEKTPESPLDIKEIKTVHLKGDQPWIFTGRTDVEAEASVFLSSDANRWLIGKVPDAGKDWGEGEEGVRGWDGWMVSPMQWTWTWVNSGRWWGTGRPGMLQSIGSQRVRHD